MLDLPTDLPADLVPLSWLVGVWEGTGVIDYAACGHHFDGEFAHRVSFSHDGGPYLNYSASAWLLADGERTPLVSEMGYWRLSRPAGASDVGPGLLPALDAARRSARPTTSSSCAMRPGGSTSRPSIIHSDGVSELYLGQVRGPRIDIATDAVVRTAGAKPYAAASRMFGLVEQHLLWAWDIAALGGELSSHASARLARVD